LYFRSLTLMRLRANLLIYLTTRSLSYGMDQLLAVIRPNSFTTPTSASYSPFTPSRSSSGDATRPYQSPEELEEIQTRRNDAYIDDNWIASTTLDDLSSRKKGLPDAVKLKAHQWMRKHGKLYVSRGNSSKDKHFQELCQSLGFLDESKEAKLRETLIQKLENFVVNSAAKFLREGMCSKDDKGEPIWAPWTESWLDENWDGNVDPPNKGQNSSVHKSSRPRDLQSISAKRKNGQVNTEFALPLQLGARSIIADVG